MKNVYNLYQHIEFPPYEYREYPKCVDTAGGPLVVNNKAEELEVLAGDTSTAGQGAVETAAAPDERTLLIDRAAKLGLDVKSGTPTAKLRAMVDAAA